MTHTTHQNPAMLRDVLYEFAVAKPVPNAELLDEFVRQYPEHADDLTDLAVELVVGSLRSESAEPVPETTGMSPAVSRAMSKFQNALHAVKAREATLSARGVSQAPAENPFASYERQRFRKLASELHANSMFACKLRDRLIDARTMTAGFIKNLADAMQVPVDAMLSYFDSAGPVLTPGQMYKADCKPEAGPQQTFEQAVRSSGLSEEQQRFLLDL